MGSRYRNYDDNTLKKTIYWIGGALAAGILVFTVLYMVFSKRESSIDTEEFAYLNNTEGSSIENASQASSQVGKTVNEIQNENVTEMKTNEKANNIVENKSVNSVTNTSSNTTITNTEVESEPKKTQEEKIKEANPDPVFKMPCGGNIIREYAKENLVYSDTLKEWVAHYGIDISADYASVVTASANGTVKSIKNDPRYGLTVTVSHDNGFTTVYSNLATAEFVVEGETIEQGQTIGTVGNTATFEILDDSHLHFELLKDGEYVSPEIYIKD